MSFQEAMGMIHEKADAGLTRAFVERLKHFKENFKQCESSVQSCLEGLSDEPTVLELQVAAFVVNGGFLFKYGMETESDGEFGALLEEMSLFASEEES